MKVQILSFLFSCIPLLVMQAQTIIPFRNVARTFATDDSIAAESVVPNCIISITDDSKAKINYTFENAVENKSLVDGVNYSHLRIKGFGINTRIGCPQLPGYTDIIAVKTEAPTVRIVSSDYVEYTDFDIFPAQIPETESDTASHPFVKDSTIYATNAFYPQNLVEVQDVQKYRGIPQALVRVNPVQYNPVTRTIRCHSNIVYELDNAMTTEEIEDAVPYEVVAALEDTDTVEALYYTSPDKYIIVTVDKYKSTLTSFVQSKEQLGYKVVVLSKPSWSSSTEVKSAIQTEYDRSENSRPRFLLIVGGHEDVPAGIKYNWWFKSNEWNQQEPYVTDHYYSCMDGENDYWPDLARGRWDINGVSELSVIIEKITNYTRTQHYTGNIALCAEFEPLKMKSNYWESDNTMENARFIKTSEEVRDYLLTYQDYQNAERIYYAPQGCTPLRYNVYHYSDGSLFPEELRDSNFNWQGSNGDVIDAINGNVDFILYRGHGNVDSWTNNLFSITDISFLTNTQLYPFIFNTTCLTGKFYNMTDNLPTNCFASSLLNAPQKGACGVIAASEATFSGYNDVFVEGMFNAIFPNPGISPQMAETYENGYGNSLSYTPYSVFDTTAVYAMGEVMNEGIKKQIQCYGIVYEDNLQTNTQIQNIQRFHLFGDPSTEIYTGIAQNLNNITISQVNGRISVNTNGLEDCRIILKPTEDEDSLEFQMVDHLIGTFTFEYSDCDYEIIIQKHNCRPVYKTLTNAHDIYLQNQVQTTDKIYNGRNIYVGKNVTAEISTGDYVVKSGANLELNSTGNVTLSSGFTVKKGGTLEINK
ncbi:MAG: hypothetical protein IJX44_00785 [Bacteroidaceae bacterium]|nr:hypothetical protein [Bacteroidaceae bacterium]